MPNEGSGTLSVIDTATDQVVAEIAVGAEAARHRGLRRRPHRLRQRPAEQRARDRRPRGAQALGNDRASAHRPKASASRPTAAGSPPRSRRPTRSSSSTRERNAKAFVVKVRGKNPEHAVFTPDGRYVFVSAEDGEAVDIIDVAQRAQVAPDAGRRAAARHRLLGRQQARLRRRGERRTRSTSSTRRRSRVLAKIKAGLRSNGVAVHPDGKRAVRLERRRRDGVGDRPRDRTARSRRSPVGQRPWNMALTPDGKKLYVACGRSGERLGDRHRAGTRRSPTSPSASCPGASRSADRALGRHRRRLAAHRTSLRPREHADAAHRIAAAVRCAGAGARAERDRRRRRRCLR